MEDVLIKVKALSKRLVSLESEFSEEKKKDEKFDQKEELSRVIYVGHIPHGFFEMQQEKFFSQFGAVKNVRISRSKRSGRSKGYGFVEFDSAEVARIAAATMNKYLMGDKQLVVHVVPIELATRSDLFKGRRLLPPASHKKRKITEKNSNAARILQRQEAKRIKINQALGFDYQFSGHSLISPAPAPAQDEEKQQKKKKKKKMASS